MRNHVKHFCEKRNLAPSELAAILGVSALDLYLAQSRDDAYGSVRDAVAVFFGFGCWSDLIAQSRMDEFRAEREKDGRASGRMLMYTGIGDNRTTPEREPREIVRRRASARGEVVFWLFDDRYYIDMRRAKGFIRVQRYVLAEAEEAYREAVKEITA